MLSDIISKTKDLKREAEDRSMWQKSLSRGVYPYLPMATNAPWSIFFSGRGSIKSLILSFNIQKCEFCA